MHHSPSSKGRRRRGGVGTTRSRAGYRCPAFTPWPPQAGPTRLARCVTQEYRTSVARCKESAQSSSFLLEALLCVLPDTLSDKKILETLEQSARAGGLLPEFNDHAVSVTLLLEGMLICDLPILSNGVVCGLVWGIGLRRLAACAGGVWARVLLCQTTSSAP